MRALSRQLQRPPLDAHEPEGSGIWLDREVRDCVGGAIRSDGAAIAATHRLRRSCRMNMPAPSLGSGLRSSAASDRTRRTKSASTEGENVEQTSTLGSAATSVMRRDAERTDANAREPWRVRVQPRVGCHDPSGQPAQASVPRRRRRWTRALSRCEPRKSFMFIARPLGASRSIVTEVATPLLGLTRNCGLVG